MITTFAGKQASIVSIPFSLCSRRTWKNCKKKKVYVCEKFFMKKLGNFYLVFASSSACLKRIYNIIYLWLICSLKRKVVKESVVSIGHFIYTFSKFTFFRTRALNKDFGKCVCARVPFHKLAYMCVCTCMCTYVRKANISNKCFFMMTSKAKSKISSAS